MAEPKAFSIGDEVEVRRRFDQQWATGFEIVEVTDEGVRVRRNSDGEVLPVVFSLDEVRPPHKHRSMWWMTT